MTPSRLFWKLWLGHVLVIVLTASVVGLQVGRRAERQSLDRFRERLREAAVVARELAARTPPGPELQRTVDAVGEETGVRFTLIAADGTVLADSERDPARLENHSDRPELAAARRGGEGTATRWSESVRVRLLYLAIPGPPDSPVAFVRAAVGLDAVDHRISDLRRTVLTGTALAALLGLGVAALVARSFSRPLVQMSEAARSIAGGHFGRRIPIDRRDEIGAFGRAFNLMAGQLEERIEELTEDRNKLLAILGGMVEGVVAVDPDERVVHLNRVAGRMLGADRSAAIGKPFRSVTRVAEIADVLSETIRSGVDRTREILLPGFPQGRVLEVHSGPVRRDDAGAPLGAVVVLHDVTELRRLEAVRRDFVANVSHELKTPLTALRGILETMLDDPAMPEDTRRRFLEKMDDQSRRLATLVTDLLSLARIESRPEDLEREALDLRIPVRESLRALDGAARDRRIDVRSELPGAALVVRGDRTSLRLLVDNLVDNAVKYTPEGGRVHVRLGTRDGWAELEVEDTGIGIEDIHRERVFERFYRVDKARSRELGGTGLGLSIVKHVALAHDGDVTLESRPGRGSTFLVRLPVAGAEKPPLHA